MDTLEKVILNNKKKNKFPNMVGVNLEEVRPGYARATLTVEDRHLNPMDITHGAAVFTLVDTVFGVASNSHGKPAVALNMSINFLKATKVGSVLTATVQEDSLTRNTGLYRIEVKDDSGDLVSLAEGLVFRKKEDVV